MAIRPSRHGYSNGFAKPPTPAVYRRIAYSFFAVTIFVVIGALWISSVRARITVTVRRDMTSVQSAIDIAKSPDQGQLTGRVMRTTYEKIQEFSVSATSTGSEAPSIVTGIVKISNTYSKAQTLVKTTRLLAADGRLYRIDKTVTIEPNTSVSVSAYSDQPGKQYVLAQGTKLTIPGLWIDLQKWIYAESVSGFSGGVQTSKTVSSADVQEAQRALEDAVFEQAKKSLTTEAGATDDSWGAVFTKTVVDSKSNVTPGQQSEQFLASIKLEVTGVFFLKDDLNALIRQKMSERLPDGRDLIDFDPSNARLSIEQADPKIERARLAFSAQSSSRLTESSPALSKDALAGLSLEEVRTKLKAIDGVETVDIVIRPSWIGKIPTMKDHIDINIQ